MLYQYYEPGDPQTANSVGGFVVYIPRNETEAEQIIFAIAEDKIFNDTVREGNDEIRWEQWSSRWFLTTQLSTDLY